MIKELFLKLLTVIIQLSAPLIYKFLFGCRYLLWCSSKICSGANVQKNRSAAVVASAKSFHSLLCLRNKTFDAQTFTWKWTLILPTCPIQIYVRFSPGFKFKERQTSAQKITCSVLTFRCVILFVFFLSFSGRRIGKSSTLFVAWPNSHGRVSVRRGSRFKLMKEYISPVIPRNWSCRRTEMLTEYSGTPLYGHPVNTDTPLLRTVWHSPTKSSYISLKNNPLNTDTR